MTKAPTTNRRRSSSFTVLLGLAAMVTAGCVPDSVAPGYYAAASEDSGADGAAPTATAGDPDAAPSMHVGGHAQAYWLIPRHQTKLPTPNSADGLDHTPALVADELPDDSQVAGNPLAGSQGLQTNNPGWPGFGSSGAVVGGGVYVAVTW